MLSDYKKLVRYAITTEHIHLASFRPTRQTSDTAHIHPPTQAKKPALPSNAPQHSKPRSYPSPTTQPTPSSKHSKYIARPIRKMQHAC